VKLACSPSCQTIYIDGHAVPPGSAEVAVAPGDHLVSATAPNRSPAFHKVHAEAGQTAEVRLVLAAKHCGKFLDRCN
jgi:hypothetical protein